MRTDCPKCGSKSAWYEVNQPDLVLRCTCGLYKVVRTTLKNLTIEHVTKKAEIKLPRKDTLLWHTLMTLAGMVQGSSADIVDGMKHRGIDSDVPDISSYLTILKTKGLVVTITSRKGLTGGSTWQLTETCNKLLGVKHGPVVGS